MAHTRERYLHQILLADLRWSPAVAVFGMRQAGKTTLSQQIGTQLKGTYETFDQASIAESARQTPLQFCERTHLLIIDEAQKVPEIFPAIKDKIGVRRAAGRFLLTGSVRFTLKRDIREALTGRILIRELLPFCYAEIHHRKPSSLFMSTLTKLTHKDDKGLNRVILEKHFHQNTLPTQNDALRHCLAGGLPVPCFTRDSERRRAWFDSYVETLLTRDISLVNKKLSVIALQQSKAFLKALAHYQGSEPSYQDLATQGGLRLSQVQPFLEAVEALCVIERFSPEIHSKKSSRKLRIEWRDCGLRNHIAGEIWESISDFSLPALHLLISQQLRSQLQVLGYDPSWSFYRSRNGGAVPWIIRVKGRCIALTYVPHEAPKPYDYRALKQFLEKEPTALGVVLGAPRASIACLGPRLWLIPWLGVL